jgi:6-phosphogluconolactonase (cycloisomerase 2 family)
MKSLQVFPRSGIRLVLAAMLFILSVFGSVSPALASNDTPGAVYTLSNAASGNEVLAFDRSAGGSLVFQGAYATGGQGSGAGLGSQGALALSRDNRWLFAVNAGSNQISIFDVQPDGLVLVDVADSGGTLPISLTNYKNLLYVLNAGGSGNITGFEIGEHGSLSPIAASTQPLSNGGAGAAPGPAQISFAPDGSTLIVTEKASNLIVTYPVEGGVAGAPVAHPSSGMTPFGFEISQRGVLVVSEAFGGAPGASALSSYTVDQDGLNLVSASVPTTQTAACWVAIFKDGRYAYTTNAGSGSISSYAIDQDGSISLLDPAAGLTGEGSSPIDMAFSNNGSFLYALSAAAHTISIFQAQADGSLVSLGSLDVPAGSVGLAAR